MEIDLRLGDCIEVMQEMEPESIDTVITDPPYGLSDEPDIIKLLTAWIEEGDYEPKNSDGFMGKEWDAIVPGPRYWKEVCRVMKPGGMLLAFGGTRTVDLLTIALRIAGFEIRDQIEWVYGSGFNKGGYFSLSLERRLTYIDEDGDRRYESDDELMQTEPPFRYPGADKWWGWAPALKPAHEPIILAMKPINGSFLNNMFENKVAGYWIDGGRVPTEEDCSRKPSELKSGAIGYLRDDKPEFGGRGHPKGRWPANLILSHDPRCKKVGQKKIKGRQINRWKDGAKPFGGGAGGEFESEDFGMEVVDVYDCHPDCPLRIMDEQSGVSVSSGGQINKKDGGDVYAGGWGGNWKKGNPGYGDEGGASRFFYCAKASRSEKDAGLDTAEIIMLELTHDSKSSNKEKKSWVKEGQSHLLLVDMEQSTVKVIGESTTTEGSGWSIESFGKSIMELSPKDITFITKTGTNSTTKSRTYNWLIQLLTSESTQDVSFEKVNGGNHAGNVEKCNISVSITSEKAGCLPGVKNVASGMRLKISANEGNGNVNKPGKLTCFHPTVKSIDLIRYLVRLTKTPDGGVVLDPFMGSGTTGIGCVFERRDFIGIEKEPDYMEIAKLRIEHYKKDPEALQIGFEGL